MHKSVLKSSRADVTELICAFTRGHDELELIGSSTLQTFFADLLVYYTQLTTGQLCYSLHISLIMMMDEEEKMGSDSKGGRAAPTSCVFIAAY